MEKINTDQAIAIIVATIIVVILAVFTLLFFLLFKRKKTLLQKENEQMRVDYEKILIQSQIEVQEATLSTLSKELHDNIGQLLSTAKMLLGITEINLTNPPDTLRTANETVGKAINELRSLSKSLSKEWLEQFNLIENLITEVNRINSADAVRLHLSHPEKLALETDKQVILFRIIQEAMQNAIKHASAKNIYINITQSNDLLKTIVKDDGVGFNHENLSDGVGIINLKHRAKLLGGAVELKTSNEGSTVLITLPVKYNEP
jgi:signal transduction histidine kinase